MWPVHAYIIMKGDPIPSLSFISSIKKESGYLESLPFTGRRWHATLPDPFLVFLFLCFWNEAVESGSCFLSRPYPK